MKQLIKELLRESLIQQDTLNEGWLKNLVAAGLLSLGSVAATAQLKPEYKRQIDSISKVQTLTPQQKRAEIAKIVQMNRGEITGKKRADFLKTMAAAGFTDEKKYIAYLKKNAKKDDVGLDGLYTAKDTEKAEDDETDAVSGPSFISKCLPNFSGSHCIYSDEDKSGVDKD